MFLVKRKNDFTFAFNESRIIFHMKPDPKPRCKYSNNTKHNRIIHLNDEDHRSECHVCDWVTGLLKSAIADHFILQCFKKSLRISAANHFATNRFIFCRLLNLRYNEIQAGNRHFCLQKSVSPQHIKRNENPLFWQQIRILAPI